MKKILVIGKNGQLGNALQDLKDSNEWKFLGSDDLNLLETQTIFGKLEREDFDILINAAAYTAVDRAEDESELAFRINAEALAPIAESCRLKNADLFHISTDYVFGKVEPRPINEATLTNPESVYGSTKLKGEKTIQSIHKAHYIIRTAWLYGSHGKNFLNTMLDLGKKRNELKVVFDQVGSPTNVDHLARAISAIINSYREDEPKNYGMYHFSNEGVCSWYDFAHAIFELTDSEMILEPVDSGSYPSKAVRPNYSVLDKRKIKDTFGIQIPHWRDGLKECLNKMNLLNG